jgi:hypothetical protein
MKARRFLSSLLVLPALAAFTAACASSAPPPEAPAPASAASMAAPTVDSADAERAPESAEDAEGALARAESDLDASLGPSGRSGASRAEELKESPDARCDTACRAFSSMERAAGHLCSIAGDANARCVAARARVQRASERVRAACPACTPTNE